jgi:hypothetical protein
MPLGRLDAAWVEVSAAMPLGWYLESLRCTSTGQLPEQRSFRWTATASSPAGESLEGHGDEEVQALRSLARVLRERRGSASG